MSVPRPTEMTVRRLLLNELEKRGVKVNPEVSFSTLIGRMVPDAVLQNGGDYVVETKLGAEAKLFDALIRLYDYSKYTEARGAFAILFPEQLRRPWSYEILEQIAADPKLSYRATALFKDLRPTQHFAGNLSQIADWIAGHVLKPPVVEADTSLAIRVLSDAVDFITASTRQLGGKELEDIFGGKTVFENILQYEEAKYPLEEMRKAATYLLINQILFYHVLSNVDLQYPAIDETKIRRPADLAGYFEEVLKKDYSSTFGFDVASRFPDDATEMVRKVIKVIKALAPQKIRHDVLGKVFHELIPFKIRKAVAAFYTNNEAAELLAQLAIDDPSAKVIDLAVGSGTLLVAPYRRKRELLVKTKGTFELKDHKRFLEEDLTGVDIMPFAAHLAVVHLSLQALLYEYETEKVRIAVWDSTKLRPGQIIPAISRELKAAYKRPTLEMFMQGIPSIEEAYVKKHEEIHLEPADVVIMNPPFTRQERLPKEYKVALTKRFQEYEKYLHGQLGLYGYFTFLADRFAKPGGRLVLVLPATVLKVESARGVRELLANNYHVEYIITTWQRAAFSEGAQFREILLVAKKLRNIKGKHKIPSDLRCTIVTLKRLPRRIEEAKIFSHKIKIASKEGTELDSDRMNLFFTTQAKLKETVDDWFPFISTYNTETLKVFEKIVQISGKRLIPFSYDAQEFDLRYVRKGDTHGFVVRHPSRAIKLIDKWYVSRLGPTYVIAINRFTNEEAKIPYSATSAGLRRTAKINLMDVSDDTDFVITSKFKGIEKIIQRPDIIHRWKRTVKAKASYVILTYDFDLSAPGTSFLAFYSDSPIIAGKAWCIKGISMEDAKLLALWFNSVVNLLQVLICRIETRGAWMRFREWGIRGFLRLDFTKLRLAERQELLQLFNEVGKTKMPSLLKQLEEKHPTRCKIDLTILQVLGFDSDEASRIIEKTYSLLVTEIKKLKALMAGK